MLCILSFSTLNSGSTLFAVDATHVQTKVVPYVHTLEMYLYGGKGKLIS